MYCADHPSNCKRGGVCIFHKGTILLKVLNILNLNEWINFEVSIANKICSLIHLYRSPSQTQDKSQIFWSNLELNLDSLSSCNPFLTIMIGDFNAKSKQCCETDKTSFECSQLQFLTFLVSFISNNHWTYSHFGKLKVLNRLTIYVSTYYGNGLWSTRLSSPPTATTK